MDRFCTILPLLCISAVLASPDLKVATTPCPCSDPSFCDVISTPPRKEVFAFWVGSPNWMKFDWTKITTLVMFHQHDPDVMCYAHSRGVRVTSMGIFPAANLSSIEDRSAWITKQVNATVSEHLDGINIDIEYPLNASDAHLLTEFMVELTTVFHTSIPNSQVTFDVAWSPDCIDERCYDYKGIADACDFVFIMAYAEQSQIYGPCIAMATAPYNKTVKGIQGFLTLGIPPSKLVLGIMWDGTDYGCLSLTTNLTCYIKKVPFRGAPCSDAPGAERQYSFMMTALKTSITGRLYNATYASPYFDYKDSTTGDVRQIWYDDPASLSLRYLYAKKMNLRGVGMWDADSLDYGDSKDAQKQTQDMWDAINSFLQ